MRIPVSMYIQGTVIDIEFVSGRLSENQAQASGCNGF